MQTCPGSGIADSKLRRNKIGFQGSGLVPSEQESVEAQDRFIHPRSRALQRDRDTEAFGPGERDAKSNECLKRSSLIEAPPIELPS